MKPGWEAAELAISAAFDAAWRVNGALRTPVHWPADRSFAMPAGEPWVRLSIQWGEGRRVSVGPALDRHTGVVTVQVFTPAGSGNAVNSELCDAAAEALADRRLPCEGGRVAFGTASLRVIGDDRGGGPWRQQNVSVPFRRDKS